MQSTFHPLSTTQELPSRLNNPFCYDPHPLCQEAARQVCNYLAHTSLQAEIEQGKMLGVLVCLSAEGRLGFLAAYSGQLGGRMDWPWFVPAVFDYLQPDGYFKQEEATISAMNEQIATMEQSPALVSLRQNYQQLSTQAEAEIAAYKQMMAMSKQQRDALRQESGNSEDLTRQSQFQKAELRRLKQRWHESLVQAGQQLQPLQQAIATQKATRHQRSDLLQQWLFDHFTMVNIHGEQSTLTTIFSHTPQGIPPSGAGECCAPKLLQYAFQHGLKPLCMAEFWQGRSPRMEIRHHGQYYPACRGKCKPILEWMLQENFQDDKSTTLLPEVLYDDQDIVVVDKPSGLLSVPGKSSGRSVESLLQEQYGEIHMVHRLDQDTSGLMVVARTMAAYHHLQQQFLHRKVSKQYVALLHGEVHGRGIVSLPLRPDLLDRPRQVVDRQHGKEAVTHYEVIDCHHGLTRIVLTPHTGRTHQLRMHCAHHEGLAAPIVGDNLYGLKQQKEGPDHPRLCLHATMLTFAHPVTGERKEFHSEAPF
ncbi:MAG: RluA family pseudouridine synthase [Prevotella sp.]|nr:RluA family pseudouridine synthase [Prevotella sp.]